MKKKILLTMIMAAGMSLCACGTKAGEAPTTAEKTAEETSTAAQAASQTEDIAAAEDTAVTEDAADYKISVEYEQLNEETNAEDGTLLANTSVSYPVFTIEEKPEAAKLINEYFAGSKTDFQEDDQSTLQAEYEYSMSEDIPWNAYEFSADAKVARKDNQIISVQTNGYIFTGGAHGSSYESADNFDTSSGARLTLADVSDDETKAHTFVEEFILQKIKDEYADVVLDGYEEFIPDILTDETWYMDEEGFTVICNEYIIGPHALGIIEFKIPYEECDFLKNEYKIQKNG